MVEAEPDLVFVGLGFPKQERLIEHLRPVLPTSWFLGCGAAINFVAGDCVRAPVWMQRSGLEWAHRLAKEPRRLARRYLREDAPYAVRLLATSAMRRDRTDPDEWEDVLTPAEREEWFSDDGRAPTTSVGVRLAVPEPARRPDPDGRAPAAADTDGPSTRPGRPVRRARRLGRPHNDPPEPEPRRLRPRRGPVRSTTRSGPTPHRARTHRSGMMSYVPAGPRGDHTALKYGSLAISTKAASAGGSSAMLNMPSGLRSSGSDSKYRTAFTCGLALNTGGAVADPGGPLRGRVLAGHAELADHHRLRRACGGEREERPQVLAERHEPRARVDVDAHPVDLVVAGVERRGVAALEALDRRAPHPGDVAHALGGEERTHVLPHRDVVLRRPHRRLQVRPVHLPAVAQQQRLAEVAHLPGPLADQRVVPARRPPTGCRRRPSSASASTARRTSGRTR